MAPLIHDHTFEAACVDMVEEGTLQKASVDRLRTADEWSRVRDRPVSQLAAETPRSALQGVSDDVVAIYRDVLKVLLSEETNMSNLSKWETDLLLGKTAKIRVKSAAVTGVLWNRGDLEEISAFRRMLGKISHPTDKARILLLFIIVFFHRYGCFHNFNAYQGYLPIN